MRFSGIFLAFCLLCLAGDKKQQPVTAEAANDKVKVTATLLADKEAIRQELGSDLGGYFTLARVQVEPKDGKPLAVSPDDFLLRSYKDGQKSGAFAPSQIAGRAAMVISSTPGQGGGIGSEPRGPTWGGIGGGRPQRLPGQDSGVGNIPSGPEGAKATVKKDEKEDPLLKTLEQKILTQKESKEPVAGLLYFSLEGKHKPKDLVLQYNGPAGKLNIPFKQ